MLWCHAVIDVPPAATQAAGEFWSRALGWRLGDPSPEHSELHQLIPDQGDTYALVQTIQEGEPRVHLDFEVDDIDETAERLTQLGAILGARTADWQVLASPGGLPFCLLQAGPQRTGPPARTWPGGHRSRLVQVCLDAPRHLFDAETAFWRQATGWAFEPSSRPEFAGKLRPGQDGSLQFLLQCLEEEDPGKVTRAHLDPGSDDVEAEVTRLVNLGAERVTTGIGWVVMRDPGGLAFCVTANDPG
jgi:predicted enzyme related to lactoylglutathione lyase